MTADDEYIAELLADAPVLDDEQAELVGAVMGDALMRNAEASKASA
jgi:hypothetical protein